MIRSRQCHVRNESGFTLLEMLAAIAIFAMVSLSAWQMMQGVLTAKEVSGTKYKRLQAIEYTMLVLEQDFRQVMDRGVRVDGTVSEQSLFAGKEMLDSDDQGIAFTRLGWRNPQQKLPRSQLQKVSYSLKDGVLERQHFYVLDPEEDMDPVTRPLLSDVTALKFRFFIKGRWLDILPEGSTMPQGLSVTMELKDYGQIERRFLLVDSWVEEEST